MVTTKFIGRLGNSMFQIAACIGYAKKYGYQWGVPYDPGESSILRHFPSLPRCNDNPRRYLEHKPGQDNDWFNYHEIPDVGSDVTLFGFWQSWKYFENAQEEVRKVFKLNDYPEYRNYVSIHVRRGDYVQHADSFPPVTEDYLLEAIGKFLKKDYPDIRKYMVFSDDISWCRKNFRSDQIINFEFSEGRNEFEDLSLMASCGHHIIANSTFSWWGAWLGHNPDRKVISPSHKRGNWFGYSSGVKQDCIDLLPPNWLQIEFR